jgi:Holliday junction resolvase
MPKGYASRVDNNHKEIVIALKEAGASIIDMAKLGGGLPDLIVGYKGQTFLVEIKNLKTQYGRAGLNKNQKKWLQEWTGGPFSMVTDVESALRAIGFVKEEISP